MPYLRHRSFVLAPASPSFNTPIICSSVNRFDFMVRSHVGGLYSWAVLFAGITSIDLTSKLNRVGNRVQASLSDARPFLSSRNATPCLHLRAQLLVERRRCPRVMPKREADQNRDRQTYDRPNHCERGFLIGD